MDDRRVYRATTPSGRAVYQDHAPTEDQLLWRWVEYAPAAALDAKDAEIARLRSELQSATAPHTNRITMGRAAMAGRVRLLEAEIATLRQALGGADSAMKLAEGVIVSKRELFALAQARASARAALSATTKE